MTEQEWLACTDADKMFELSGGVWDRMSVHPKLRRFAVECCRRVRHLLTEEAFLAAADAGEAFAEDPGNKDAMETASIEAWRHFHRWESSANRHQYHAAKAALAICTSSIWQAGFSAMREAAQALNQIDADSCDPAELRCQATLLRCIFGPLLFRHVSIDPSWLTWHGGLLVSMARRIYDARDFSDMPVLADALEEAGCTDQNILGHCRSGGEHVRGCWVVDALLGKQ